MKKRTTKTAPKKTVTVDQIVWTFDNGLPDGFVLYKPLQQEAYNLETVRELERQGRLIITRKRDGWKVFALKVKGRVRLYTDGLNEIDERFDHIRRELEDSCIPNRTLLVGEAIMDVGNADRFTEVGSYMNSASEKWREDARKQDSMKYMPFEVVFWDGNYCLNQPYRERLAIITRTFINLQCAIEPVEVFPPDIDIARVYADTEKWEGLVFYDSEFTGSFRLDGKNPARPQGCYKWKPLNEDDFIVRTWIPNPKDPNRLKEIVLTQIDKETGKEFYCGKLGSFNGALRSELRTAVYPFVVKVVFETRYESGALRNARFEWLRRDKRPENCVASKSYPKAKFMK